MVHSQCFFVLLRDKDGFYILILRYILPEHSFSRNDVLLKQCFNGVLTAFKWRLIPIKNNKI